MEQEDNRLCAAIKEGDYKKVESLLKSDYNVKEQPYRENIKAIFCAIQLRHVDLVSLLVENGAKFNCEELKKSDQ